MLYRITLALTCLLLAQLARAGSDLPEHIYLDENFDSFFKSGFSATLHHLSLADIIYNEGVKGSKALKVHYQGFDRGSKRLVENFLLEKPLTSASVIFDVKFCNGFDFARGGKLHGLVPLQPVAGGNRIQPEGWSARAMWGKKGQLKSYIYHQQMPGKYGDVEIAPEFHFRAGQYYRIRYDLTLNQPASAANGEFSIYVDGERRVHHQNLQFRSVDSEASKIRQFTFNTFHGGNDPSWAPRTVKGDYKRDCAYFDNFIVRSLRPLERTE